MKTSVDPNGRAYQFIRRLFGVEMRLHGGSHTFDDVIVAWMTRDVNIRTTLARLVKEKRREMRGIE